MHIGNIKDLTTAQQLLYAVTRIVSYNDDQITGFGTGFLMKFCESQSGFAPALVTNKHVIENSTSIQISLHTMDGENVSNVFFPIKFNIESSPIIYHPAKDADLCALMLGSAFVHSVNSGHPIFCKFCSLDIIPSNDDLNYFDAIEDIIMVGCPNGLFDEINNLPIIRKGITATSISQNYNGKNEFVMDMACFPGSSGSPVFVYDRNGYFDKKTNSFLFGQSRIKLVGVLYAGPTISANGSISFAKEPVITTNMMMHIGFCIKSNELIVMDSIAKATYDTEIASV